MIHKKGLAMWQVVFLLAAAVSLVVILMFINSLFGEEGRFEISIRECGEALRSADKNIFLNKGEEVSPYVKLVSVKCPLREVRVSEKNIEPALDLIDDCWRMSGGGQRILSSTVLDGGVAIYCGVIRSDDGEVNFRDRFLEKIKDEKYEFLKSEDTKFVNTNAEFVFESKFIPEKIDETGSVSVLFYNYNMPGESGFGGVVTGVKDAVLSFFGNFGRASNIIANSLKSETSATLGGIVLIPQTEVNRDNFLEDKIDSNFIDKESILSVLDVSGDRGYMIVPQKVYDTKKRFIGNLETE